MASRIVVELPPGITCEDLIGGGTSGLAALIPGTETVIKFYHGDSDDNERCKLEAAIYEHLSQSKIERPPSLLTYQGKSKCGKGILLKYARNNSMRRFLSVPENSVSHTTILRWIEQTTLALCFLHQNHVAHGDVTCDNLFLDEEYNVHLGDFTSATWPLTDERKTEDMFELGLAFYEMSTGIRLYHGLFLNPDEKMEKIKHNGLPDLSRIEPKNVADLIANCLQLHHKDAEEILSSVRHMSP
ncbi:kinase-like protein [Pseudovirgaria hyperparasitica]|uniref:Kinase-like protein n=1 Tax=Pseudovirgaria hyperparasitica TaxID=470096 RepID=A0A6A6W3G4_9PEZI|nr:kinase-like protein [Pseudovirgaria hyperparasitica]KAF2757143.1 kinase-like protein [Pseudovirgaria hyperparasitica]